MQRLIQRARKSISKHQPIVKTRAVAPSPPPPPPYAAESTPYSRANLHAHADDAFYFLHLFDTVFLIDDSSSMLGPRWREVHAALSQLVPVCTSHDDDGIDVYFMNHCSPYAHPNSSPNANNSNSNNASNSTAYIPPPSGYYNIRDASTVSQIFSTVRPAGPTPTHDRLRTILEPYMAALHRSGAMSDVRPLNLIVLTDGRPGPPNPNGFNPHDPAPLIVHYARTLDALGAPPYQLGIQFVQVGDDAGATAALEALDTMRGGFRDIVDTTKFDQRDGPLTGDAILKAVLGGVDKRLDDD